MKENIRMTNAQYQELFTVSKRTATNDLQFLVQGKLISKVGSTGKGINYILKRVSKGAIDALKGQQWGNI